MSLVEEQAVPVIAAVLPKHSDAKKAIGLILIQLAGLVLSRYFLRYDSVVKLDRTQVISAVGANIQAYLDEGAAHNRAGKKGRVKQSPCLAEELNAVHACRPKASKVCM